MCPPKVLLSFGARKLLWVPKGRDLRKEILVADSMMTALKLFFLMCSCLSSDFVSAW